jgi:hypothetical protein
MAQKLDLVATDKAYYSPGWKPELRTFGPLPYLAITGQGAPGGDAFTRKTAALYPVAYGLKKHYKTAGRDFAVPKLEGLWWVEDDRPPLEVPREEWRWKLLIRLPDFVEEAAVAEARKAAARAKKEPLIREVAFERIEEGPCVQALHVGPYATEPETLETMHRFMAAEGLHVAGLHHEIYLSDPRKGEPEKLKTVLRCPVAG